MICPLNRAGDRLCRLAGVLSELFLANVRNVAVWTDQNPRSFNRGKLSCVGSSHVFEEPAAIGKRDVRHAISGVQIPESIARR